MSKAPSTPRRTGSGTLDVEALYEKRRRQVLLFLARRTADPQIALDLWAETFAQAFARRRSFRGTTEVEAEAWLMSIAKRQLAQYYRRGKIEQRGLDRLKLERPPAPADVLAEIDRAAGLDGIRKDLATALSHLTPAVRDAVQLRVVDELEYTALASRLGISEATARVRVSRGLAALADSLNPSSAEVVKT